MSTCGWWREWCNSTLRVHGDYMQAPVGNGGRDTAVMKRCTACWVELAMLPKAVLRKHKRGLRPAHAYAISKSRLDRWLEGERTELWNEIGVGARKGNGGGETDKQRMEAVGTPCWRGEARQSLSRADFSRARHKKCEGGR